MLGLLQLSAAIGQSLPLLTVTVSCMIDRGVDLLDLSFTGKLAAWALRQKNSTQLAVGMPRSALGVQPLQAGSCAEVQPPLCQQSLS